MLLIIGRLQIQKEQIAAFQTFAREIVEEERHVEGCVGFDILQDVSQADHFLMMEQWRDRSALDHHLNSAAYRHNESKLNSFTAAEADWVEYEV